MCQVIERKFFGLQNSGGFFNVLNQIAEKDKPTYYLFITFPEHSPPNNHFFRGTKYIVKELHKLTESWLCLLASKCDSRIINEVRVV